ncbi:MAG: hypothetical protein EOM50_16445 [Erysipelotrichia bacterium]|nr:hypothetical protein [Erysipelotrichia bacterium]
MKKIEINTIEELLKITNDENIIEAFKIVKEANRMTTKVQEKLYNLGGRLVFRGFNSWSTDCYFVPSQNIISFGMANINQAGRGYSFSL